MGAGVVVRRLRTSDEEQAQVAQAELAAEGFDFLLLRDGQTWADLLDQVRREEAGVDLPAGRVPATFLVLVVDDVLVGRVSVRHRLNDFLLREGGHVGYGVRPAHRRRGYATVLMRHALDLLSGLGTERALVTCDDDNLGSAAVIERAGGVLEDVVPTDDGVPKRRYWIPTTAAGVRPS